MNENDNAFGGYKLIVDTTPADTSFDDFTLICKDANGVEISYEDYRKLPETGKKNGTVEFKYSGKPLDVTVKQAEYIAYLEKFLRKPIVNMIAKPQKLRRIKAQENFG